MARDGSLAIIELPKGDCFLARRDRREAPRLDIMCIREVDLAFDHMPEVGAFPGQDHFDFELSFSGQLLLARRAPELSVPETV